MKINTTQAAFEAAADLRAYDAAIEVISVRERIVPLRRRRIAELADMVRAAPIQPQPRRRVRRDRLV